ncbi:GNAT family N-acetyltransferase [Haliangium sp.]|uniref:GNAT family N-acetyltransferase n=1 Tax=Haliangium sp. TaxID=2663208 RepID=UPI003D0C50A4
MTPIRPLREDEAPPWELLLDADPSRHMVERYLSSSDTYVLETEAGIIGVVVLCPLGPNELEIKNIAVDDDHQGRGWGRRLLAFSIDEARARRVQRLHIGTGNSSIGQLALYQKLGFRIVGVDRDFFVRGYPEPLFENGIRCRDMIRLQLDLQAGDDD